MFNRWLNGKEWRYTDMNAVRKDEELDNLHSYYVDQWDWEKVISIYECNLDKLKDIVKKIYKVLRITDEYIVEKYPKLKSKLPEEIFFISTQELENLYPNLTDKAVFIMQIGKILKSGKVHEWRYISL